MLVPGTPTGNSTPQQTLELQLSAGWSKSLRMGEPLEGLPEEPQLLALRGSSTPAGISSSPQQRQVLQPKRAVPLNKHQNPEAKLSSIGEGNRTLISILVSGNHLQMPM